MFKTFCHKVDKKKVERYIFEIIYLETCFIVKSFEKTVHLFGCFTNE